MQSMYVWCALAAIYLANPSWWAMPSALELLTPLLQWNTMLSSSFSGALTLNFCSKSSGDSFRDSSRVPTDMHSHTRTVNVQIQINRSRLDCTCITTYVGRWRPVECGPPGIHLGFSHQKAECSGLPAWSSVGSRSPLRLIQKHWQKWRSGTAESIH